MKGELYALGAALCWASAVIFFKRSSHTVSPVSLNLFKTALSVVLLLLTLVVLGHPVFPTRPAMDYWLLFGSGLIGIALSDTLFLYGLRYLGAGLSSIVECLYSPSIIVMAYLVGSDRTPMTPWEVIGLLLVLSAILTVATSGKRGKPAVPGEPGAHPSRGDLFRGIACGAGAMLTLALGVVMFDPVLEDSSGIWVSAMRTLPALLVLAAVPLFQKSRRSHLLDCFRPSRVWWTLVPGSILGTYFALIFWVLGFKYESSTRAAILNQSNTIFVLILAAIFLKEPITWRKLVAIVLGFTGVALVTLSGGGAAS